MECMEQGITIDADVDNQTGHLFEAYKAHAHTNCNITVAYKNADAYVQPQSMSPQLCTVGVFMYSKAYAPLTM